MNARIVILACVFLSFSCRHADPSGSSDLNTTPPNGGMMTTGTTTANATDAITLEAMVTINDVGTIHAEVDLPDQQEAAEGLLEGDNLFTCTATANGTATKYHCVRSYQKRYTFTVIRQGQQPDFGGEIRIKKLGGKAFALKCAESAIKKPAVNPTKFSAFLCQAKVPRSEFQSNGNSN